MDKIQDKRVIPIIGSRLLVEADGQTSLQAQVAAHLLHDYGRKPGEIALPPFREINEVITVEEGSQTARPLRRRTSSNLQGDQCQRLYDTDANRAVGKNSCLSPLRDVDPGRLARP